MSKNVDTRTDILGCLDFDDLDFFMNIFETQ